MRTAEGPISGGRAGRAGASLGTLALLALVPKCPLCVAALLSSLGLGMTAATALAPFARPGAVVLAASAIALLGWLEARRLVERRPRGACAGGTSSTRGALGGRSCCSEGR